MKKAAKFYTPPATSKPDLESWLTKEGLLDSSRKDNQTAVDSKLSETNNRETEVDALPEPLPECLKHIPIQELPLSLLPPGMRTCIPAPTPDWGE